MRAFERPGEFRIYLERDYMVDRLQEAENAVEFTETLRQLLQEGEDLLNRLEVLDRQIRELAREERNLELDLHDLRRKRRVRPFERRYSDEELDKLISERSAEHARVVERRKQLQDERDERADHLARNHVTLRVERDALDLTGPDVETIKREVGEPVAAHLTTIKR